MKNKKILLAILAIALVFGMTACKDKDDGEGGGGLTITGIPAEYNGKYFYAIIGTIWASDKRPIPTAQYGAKISGGEVTTSVWEPNTSATTADNAYKAYTGSGQNLTLNIVISDASEGMVAVLNLSAEARGTTTVSFTNGKASVDVSGVTFTP